MKPTYYDQDDYEDELEREYPEDTGDEEPDEVDEDIVTYADAEFTDEDDVLVQSTEAGKRRKSPERLAREARFMELYQEFMNPSREYSQYRVQCQLDDLYMLLWELNWGWAYRKALAYKRAGFQNAEGEDALSIGSAAVYQKLKADRENGNFCTYPIAYYLRIAQNKAIDQYFRPEFGRLPPRKKSEEYEQEESDPRDEKKYKRKVISTVSLDAQKSDDDDRTLGELITDTFEDPFAMKMAKKERDEKADRLMTLYIAQLMEYSGEPPKALALMFGSVLYQLHRDRGGDDAFSQLAKKSKKTTSAKWAHMRMGRGTLLQLGIFSERIIQKHYNRNLSWNRQFVKEIRNCTDEKTQMKWRDIIYTETYTEDQTTKWIESIMDSTIGKCTRIVHGMSELTEYVIETMGYKNKFRKAMEKVEKEARG